MKESNNRKNGQILGVIERYPFFAYILGIMAKRPVTNLQICALTVSLTCIVSAVNPRARRTSKLAVDRLWTACTPINKANVFRPTDCTDSLGTTSDFDPLRDLQRIIEFNAKVPDSAVHL